MRVLNLNIWDDRFDDHLRVIPINLGWRTDGCNVMGRGVARQAAERYPDLAAWLGERCRNMDRLGQTHEQPYDIWVPVHDEAKLLFFPTKPLDKIQPHLSWKQRADLALVAASLRALTSEVMQTRLRSARLERCDVVMPLVGCGNGGLDIDDVVPLLKTVTEKRFTLTLPLSIYDELVTHRRLLP